jgi:hypothetical protein
MCFSPDITRVIESRRMAWTEHVTFEGKENSCSVVSSDKV